MSSNKRNALGRGLSALLENADTDITTRSEISSGQALAGSISHISIDKIEANPFQPRNEFEEQRLNELADSIKEQGIIQPVTVRKIGNDTFQLISGERRFRASKIAGLKAIPAYVRIANDQAMLEMAIVENIQRENLNAIEIGISYKRLIDECNISQEELSVKVGKNRTTVTNYLRLLKLPPIIQAGLRDEKISMGHARALINVEDSLSQIAIFNDIIQQDLSVRKTEEMVRNNVKPSKKKQSTTDHPKTLSPEYKKVQKNLSDRLDSKVEIKIEQAGKGKILIPFLSDEDLNRIIELLDF